MIDYEYLSEEDFDLMLDDELEKYFQEKEKYILSVIYSGVTS